MSNNYIKTGNYHRYIRNLDSASYCFKLTILKPKFRGPTLVNYLTGTCRCIPHEVHIIGD